MIHMVTLLAALLLMQVPDAPGKLVDAGGYRVHLNCTGSGSPTVVIVGAGFSVDWGLVQPVISKSTRVCSYDPSGMAWSDPAPASAAGCQGRVGEIHTVLKNAGIEGPHILVGLSIGALVARLYARRYPGEVSGMVIVDHAFLNPVDEPAKIVTPGLDSPPVLISQTPIEYTMEDISQFHNLPARDQQLHRWAMSLNPVMPTVAAAEECMKYVGDSKLGSLALAVVSTGNDSRNYTALQNQLLGLSTNSWQLMALKSFHAVQIDQPEIVDKAILEVLDAVRRGARK